MELYPDLDNTQHDTVGLVDGEKFTIRCRVWFYFS